MSKMLGRSTDKESAIPLLNSFDIDEEHELDSPLSPSPLRARKPSFKKRTPLPLLQLTILCGVRLAEPIAYTQIFPYINQMIDDMKVTDQRSKIGFYSGIVDSLFAVCQLFTVFQWARLSDRIGRKPVILIGLAGVALSTSLFGLSKSLIWAIFSRSMAGALSGNVAVVESVISEITDETNQAQAFPLKGLSWSLGCIIGPIIGGTLVNPAIQWPNTFGSIPLLQEYPYLLPCVTSGFVTICSIVFGLFFMNESLPSKVNPLSRQTKFSQGTLRTKMGVKEIMSAPIIRTVCQNYFLLSCLASSFDVVFILMAYTPVRLGGLSRSPEEIGYALAFSGVAGAIIQVFMFPWLYRKYNYIPLYRGLMMLWPILYLLCPLLSTLARWTVPPDMLELDNARFPAGPLIWLGIALVFGLLRTAAMCFSVNTILVKNAAPSKEALGATFGLSQSVACAARAASPAFVSSLFALSKKHNILGGNLVWVVMFLISLLGLWSTYQVVDGAEAEEEEMKDKF